MRNDASRLLLLTALLAAGCVSPDACPATEAGAEPDTVQLVCESPMSIPAFLRLAQRHTGRIYTYDARVVEGVEVSWLGTVRCARDRVDEFVQTMLYVKGFALQRRQQGENDVLEVVGLRSSEPAKTV